MIAFVRRNPDFRYVLDKLNGYDPRVHFPGGTEPPPPPTRKIGSAAPWSPEHPRSAKRGQIPQAEHYSAKEVAFLLGLARRTVIAKLAAQRHSGDQGPRHEIRSHDHLEMANHARGSGRVRAAEPPLLVRHGPYPGLRVQQRFPLPRRRGCSSLRSKLLLPFGTRGPSPEGAPRRPRRPRMARAPAPDPPRRLQTRSQTS